MSAAVRTTPAMKKSERRHMDPWRLRAYALAVFALLFAVYPALRCFSHAEILYNEGWNVYNAQTVAAGGQLYPATPRVPTGMRPGQNCSRDLLDPAKRSLDYVVDDASHELGTAFYVRGRGLVVIGSCSHRGILNTVRRAQAVSGVEKIHAIVGGFHLVAPQTHQQVMETLAMMQALNPSYIIPGHCTGEDFIQAATQALPGKVVRSQVGRRFIFPAA